MIHVLNNLPEEYDVVLDSLETCLVSQEKWVNTRRSQREVKLKIWKDKHQEAREGLQWESFGCRIQCSVRGNISKVCWIWAQIRLTQVSRESRNWWKQESKQGFFQGQFECEKALKQQMLELWKAWIQDIWLSWKWIGKPSDQKWIEAFSKWWGAWFVALCNGWYLIEQLVEELVSSANDVAAGIQDKHPEKQVWLIDEVENIKTKLIMAGNSKSRMCNVDG